MNWKRSLIATGIVGVPIIALLGFGMTQDPRNIPSPLPGRQAPTFERAVFSPGADPSLSLPVGSTVKLDAARGHVVVVNFWASWCLACRDEHVELSQTATAFSAKGVRFYGLLYNDREANGLRWINDMGGQAYPGLSDPGARVAIDYGLYGVPETFVIDQTGRVAHKYTGPVSGAQLGQLLDSLINANVPSANGDSALASAKRVPVSADQKP